MAPQLDKTIKKLQKDAISLLKKLIAIPSFSKEEDVTANIIQEFLEERGVSCHRIQNNVFAFNKNYDPSKPKILLNSHHDTVKPNSNYTKNPFEAIVEGDKLFGLGSNDAGGPLVSLIATFLYYYEMDSKYNIIIAATAEEEISGQGGIELLLSLENTGFPVFDKVKDFAIVGEPTLMQMAIAERGLMVIDATTQGKAGHAARNEGDNALMKTMKELTKLETINVFEKVSDFLGPVKVTPTVIYTENKAHNVVPASCNYVLDCRINELYTFDNVLEILHNHLSADLLPRSTRLKSSIIPTDHVAVQAGIAIGKSYYGSPTTSDKALMPFPALKMGPGDSARSHSPDEFIFIREIEEGIEDYIQLIDQLK